LLVDECTTLLESESRYLPVLSEPSSGASSPQVHRYETEEKQPGTDAGKPRRVVANFASRPTATQRSDVIVHPTKSSSQPRSGSIAVHRHSQSPVARTLHLESSDTLETAVGDNVDTSSSRVTEQPRPVSAKRKPSRRSRHENGVAASSSLYTPEKYHSTMQQIYGDNSKQTGTQQLCDVDSCTDVHSRLVNIDQSLNHSDDIINGNDPDLQGKFSCTSCY